MTDTLVEFLRRWGELGPTSAAVLAAVIVAAGLVPIPRTFLVLAAGVVFGMAAIPVIIPATTVGCLIAFLCATQTWTRANDVLPGQLTAATGAAGGPTPDPEWASAKPTGTGSTSKPAAPRREPKKP